MPAPCGRKGQRRRVRGEIRQGSVSRWADAKSAVKDTAKELARLEKRLQKTRDVEAKRKKQAAEARAEVAQLTARIKELKPAPSARSVKTPASRAASPARSRARAKPAAAKPAAAKPAAARAAAPKPTVAVASTGTNSTTRASTTSTSTRRKTASSPATRTARTRKTVPADGSGDGTGPS